MEKLNDKQVSERFGLKYSRVANNGFVRELVCLKVDEYLFVSRKEFAGYGYSLIEGAMSNLIRPRITRGDKGFAGKRFSIRLVGDDGRASADSGWLIQRIK